MNYAIVICRGDLITTRHAIKARATRVLRLTNQEVKSDRANDDLNVIKAIYVRPRRRLLNFLIMSCLKTFRRLHKVRITFKIVKGNFRRRTFRLPIRRVLAKVATRSNGIHTMTFPNYPKQGCNFSRLVLSMPVMFSFIMRSATAINVSKVPIYVIPSFLQARGLVLLYLCVEAVRYASNRCNPCWFLRRDVEFDWCIYFALR